MKWMSVGLSAWCWVGVAVAGVHADGNVWDGYHTEYGHGQTPEFRRAIKGAGPFNAGESRAIQNLRPPKDHDRFYLRLFGYSGKRNLSRFVSLSPGNDTAGNPVLNGKVNQTAIRTYQNRGSLAFGYDFQSSRVELEYIRLSKMYYNANPIFLDVAGMNDGVRAVIRSNAWFLNLIYDVRGLAERCYPYFLIGAGGTINRASSVTINQSIVGGNPNGRQGSFHLSYGIGTGLRLGILTRLYLDAQLRYLKMGYTTLKPQNNVYLRGQHSMYFLGLGIIYLF